MAKDTKNEAATGATPGAAATERYFEIVFSQKRDTNETEEVQLIVQGNPLQLLRGVPTIVPERYLNAAKDAVGVRYRNVQGKDRKVRTEVQTYPYTVIREVTEEEYIELKRKGDELARKHAEELCTQ